MPKVSVIISNRNDVSMLAVTVRSCIEEFRAVPGGGEVVICDNSDLPIYENLSHVLPAGYFRDKTINLIRQDFPCLFTAREAAAQAAKGDYILCLDSHMICGHNMIRDLVDFMNLHKGDSDLGFAHAPINWAHQHEGSARHDRDMSVHELGAWGSRYNAARTITWKGMPWICRRKWFLDKDSGLNGYGALAEHRLSWGGGDMHIGIKPWLLGFKNWAVPTSPGIHIGPFPKIDLSDKDPNSVKVSKATNNENRYRLYNGSGNGPYTIGFLVSCFVLGGESMMQRNKVVLDERFGKYLKPDEWWQKAKDYGANEKAWLDARRVISFEDLVTSKPWEQSNAS